MLCPVHHNLQTWFADCDAMFRNTSASQTFPSYTVLQYFLEVGLKRDTFPETTVPSDWATVGDNFMFRLKFIQEHGKITKNPQRIIYMEVKRC